MSMELHCTTSLKKKKSSSFSSFFSTCFFMYPLRAVLSYVIRVGFYFHILPLLDCPGNDFIHVFRSILLSRIAPFLFFQTMSYPSFSTISLFPIILSAGSIVRLLLFSYFSYLKCCYYCCLASFYPVYFLFFSFQYIQIILLYHFTVAV